MTNYFGNEGDCSELQNNLNLNQHQSDSNDSIDSKHNDKTINTKDTDIQNIRVGSTIDKTTKEEKKISYGFFFILMDSFVKSIVDKENAPEEKNIPTEHSGSLAHQDLMDISTKYFIENSKILKFDISQKEILYLGRLCGAVLRDVSHLRGSVNGALDERDSFNRFINEKSNSKINSKTKTKLKISSDNMNSKNSYNPEFNSSKHDIVYNIESEVNQSNVNANISTNNKSNLMVKPLPSHIVGISVLEFFSGIGYVRT